MKHDTTKLLALSIAAALTLGLTGCGETNPAAAGSGAASSSASSGPAASSSAPQEGVAVQTQKVVRDSVATDNKVSGRVAADNEATIMVGTAAKCTAVYKNAGDPVKAGEAICALDVSSTLSSHSAAKISYQSAVQSYQDQKAILDKQVQMALDNWNNTKALLEIGAASQLEVDQAELNYLNAEAGRTSGLSQLEAAMQNAKSGVEQLDTALENIDSRGNVISPISGTLVTLNAVADGFVSNSMPVAVINGADQMKVSASVSEALVPKLSIGDAADVTVSAAGQTFTAEIRSVERAANLQTKLYTVTLTVPADVGGLLSGMFADVTFHTDASSDTIVVPSEAILTNGDAQYVYIVEDGSAKYVAVTTGLTGSGVTEITSGLEGGEELVTVGQSYLEDGAAVRVVDREA